MVVLPLKFHSRCEKIKNSFPEIHTDIPYSRLYQKPKFDVQKIYSDLGYVQIVNWNIHIDLDLDSISRIGISSPKHPSHTETCKYIFLIDFGTLNTNL